MDNQDLISNMSKQLQAVIKKWEKEDIYAISLLINDYCDNPCQPIVTLGYNTESQYRRSLEYAVNEKAARWDYAYWLHNREYVFGVNDTLAFTVAWLKQNQLPYFPTVDYKFTIPKQVDRELLEKITSTYLKAVIDMVKDWHNSGFLVTTFSKSIVVIIHELEYHEEILTQNLKANPQENIKEFADWFSSWFYY